MGADLQLGHVAVLVQHMDVVVRGDAVDALPFVLLGPVHLHSKAAGGRGGADGGGEGSMERGRAGMWAPRFSDQQLEQTLSSA